jgi:hypothetical protein
LFFQIKESTPHQKGSNKVQQSLAKIHENYKFVSNYLSDLEIIGKLNGYELAGEE